MIIYNYFTFPISLDIVKKINPYTKKFKFFLTTYLKYHPENEKILLLKLLHFS